MEAGGPDICGHTLVFGSTQLAQCHGSLVGLPSTYSRLPLPCREGRGKPKPPEAKPLAQGNQAETGRATTWAWGSKVLHPVCTGAEGLMSSICTLLEVLGHVVLL